MLNIRSQPAKGILAIVGSSNFVLVLQVILFPTPRLTDLRSRAAPNWRSSSRCLNAAT
jgi:hypothetical protein